MIKADFQKVYFVIRCDELRIFRKFTDKSNAIIFADQLALDYPAAKIERLQWRLFFDVWGDE